mgnify:CR=1 FL=1
MNIIEFKNLFGESELFGEKIIMKSDIAKSLQFLKENYGYNILKEIIAIDNRDDIELSYRLYSPDDDEDVIITTFVKDEAESVSKIFDSAVADEKEIFDLFGIKFTCNDELERLYMPESWKGHPLRKNYEENDERLKWND